ncbi:dTDP-4-amino-4,6-dideoxygalactose transaminase [Collimonas sp.]|jgi:dTDP-4-amino-4,6-dideoxygalactose transaminase|uniref:dTDP-4-amino-4,6-dideoxygalactose transaminase n=1 Tax=Collimonas sp. TaxID=1963772 RepID=UPI002C392943|nr:dTDP-4-amino-4,6-dideoxygalactose transaminase [Collimonas sp.]HWX00139.1 dTDP-4-amino-4,6-dideoxygalactose transaminase [Collimonas sp.]
MALNRQIVFILFINGFKMIPFNRPYLTGNEQINIAEVMAGRKLAGDGIFTKQCHEWFERIYGFKKALLTTSCTDALEMCALLLDIKVGDEVIVPSYTFVSTANAFALRGATIRFADSQKDNPNIAASEVERLINSRTKAIVVVHYAGISCDMDRILAIAEKHNVAVIEDAAQAIDSYHNGRPLGSLGVMSAFSFHETKNIICGEGGLLAINDSKYIKRAEIIREKGTNRSSFFRGEVDKYGWVDVGSSFLPSDILAAFLFAQIQALESIQNKRKHIWQRYWDIFSKANLKADILLPQIPEYATNNAHMFYLVCSSLEQRTTLIDELKANKISAVFHYLSLHKSPFFIDKHDGSELPNSDRYTDCLVRLPMFVELTDDQIDVITRITLSVLR